MRTFETVAVCGDGNAGPVQPRRPVAVVGDPVPVKASAALHLEVRAAAAGIVRGVHADELDRQGLAVPRERRLLADVGVRERGVGSGRTLLAAMAVGQIRRGPARGDLAALAHRRGEAGGVLLQRRELPAAEQGAGALVHLGVVFLGGGDVVAVGVGVAHDQDVVRVGAGGRRDGAAQAQARDDRHLERQAQQVQRSDAQQLDRHDLLPEGDDAVQQADGCRECLRDLRIPQARGQTVDALAGDGVEHRVDSAWTKPPVGRAVGQRPGEGGGAGDRVRCPVRAGRPR